MHIIVGLIIAFIVVAIFARRNSSVRNCRWRADRSGDRDGLHKYRCMACGAQAFCETDDPPRVCKAQAG
jgi:hypothetical protein